MVRRKEIWAVRGGVCGVWVKRVCGWEKLGCLTMGNPCIVRFSEDWML